MSSWTKKLFKNTQFINLEFALQAHCLCVWNGGYRVLGKELFICKLFTNTTLLEYQRKAFQNPIVKLAHTIMHCILECWPIWPYTHVDLWLPWLEYRELVPEAFRSMSTLNPIHWTSPLLLHNSSCSRSIMVQFQIIPENQYITTYRVYLHRLQALNTQTRAFRPVSTI